MLRLTSCASGGGFLTSSLLLVAKGVEQAGVLAVPVSLLFFGTFRDSSVIAELVEGEYDSVSPEARETKAKTPFTISFSTESSCA